MGVVVTSHISEWSAETAAKLDTAMLDLVTVIHRDATHLAPRLTGALIASGRIVRNGMGDYSVVFGGGHVPYARRRHYENKKHPDTLLYLERAGDSNSRNFTQYIKGI